MPAPQLFQVMSARQLLQAMPARQLPRVTSDPPWSPSKLLLLVSLLLVLELAGAVGTDHPSNDTRPYNSGGLDVHLDLERNETYSMEVNNIEHVCTVPYFTVKSSQCTSQKEYTCYPPEEECRKYHHPRIVCYGHNKGYIQVSKGLMRGVSCVTLEVPADHFAMISFGGVSMGWFTVHKNAACEGEGENKRFDYTSTGEPEVYDLRAVSFRFDLRGQTIGFSIIYSFHKTTAKLEKLRNGQWNCSVPYFSQFNDHFICQPNGLCSDSRSTDRCGKDMNFCCYNFFWKSFSSGPGQCYFVVISQRLRGRNAKNLCSSVHGRPMSPNSPAFTEVLTSLTDGNGGFFVDKIKQFVPDMYQDTWVWEDNTLAMHSKLRVNSTAELRKENCGSLQCNLVTKQDNHYILSPIDCSKLVQDSGIVCDMSNSALRDGESDVNFLLPTVVIEPTDEFFM